MEAEEAITAEAVTAGRHAAMQALNALPFSRKKTPQNILRGFYCAFILFIYTVRNRST